jgi:hypothetical protein
VIDPSGAAVPKAKVSLFLAGGSQTVAETATTTEGLFTIEAIRPEYYDLLIEAPGFQPYKQLNVKVDPARATDLAAARLVISTATTAVEVTAGPETVQVTTTDISTTVTAEQISRLPVADRNPLDFVATQAGVSVTAAGTSINGQRVSFSNMSVDGVNNQDNFIKDNALTYTPNQLMLSQIKEFTATTSNAGAAAVGASGVTWSTPSGGNTIHGELLYQNRNNSLAANSFFNNLEGVPLPRLNYPIYEGNASGPLRRDRLFYYVSYEAHREHTQATFTSTILTADARQGMFTYRNTAGQVVKANVLNIVGLRPDAAMAASLAQVPGPEKINSFRVGDSQEGDLRNTAGYSFLVRSNRERDNVAGRLDYNLSSRHAFRGTFAWNRDLVDRPDLGVGYSSIPPISNDNPAKLLGAGWRWNPSATFTNELRGGFNFAPGYFLRSDQVPSYFIGGMVWASPVPYFQPQGREMQTYVLDENATWVRGRHTVQFGYYLQTLRLSQYDYFDTTPTYNVGVDSLAQQNNLLFPSDLPRISAADFGRANDLLASLAGLLDNANVSYNAASRTSGFVPGAPYSRNWSFDNHAFYLKDNWKAARRLSVNAGLRWDYFTPVNERDALALQPLIASGDARATMLSNSTLYFTGNAVNRPFYAKDFNNFAPSVGLAWDVFGNGRTSFRAGYGVSFAPDQQTTVGSAYTGTNAGLSASVARVDLTGFMNSNRPGLPAPRYFVPRNFSDNYALDPFSYFGMLDPQLRTPYAQQFSASVQHEFRGTIIEARYVGNHAAKMLRGFDYNQTDFRSNGFLDDFLRAQNNGNLARNLTGVFDARYNPQIPGSQVLTRFPQLVGGGFLTAGIVRQLIDQGQVAELVYIYQVLGLNGSLNFFPNPNALSAVYATNFARSSYDSLQLEARRRFQRGLEFQLNYTFSKWLSNTLGTDQLRFEPFLDINNPALERSRHIMDLTHQFKANYSYDLPFGAGHRLQSRHGWLNRIMEGWSSSGNLRWSSGNPFGIDSGRGTFLRAGFSGTNEANTIYDKQDLTEIIGLRKTGAGVFMVPQSARYQDGRGVAPDGQAPFQGQLFTNPGAGQVGALQRRILTGPSVFYMDASVERQIRLTERFRARLRMEALNVFNHPTFMTFDLNVNSTQFGRMALEATSPRRVQLSLRINF